MALCPKAVSWSTRILAATAPQLPPSSASSQGWRMPHFQSPVPPRSRHLISPGHCGRFHVVKRSWRSTMGVLIALSLGSPLTPPYTGLCEPGDEYWDDRFEELALDNLVLSTAVYSDSIYVGGVFDTLNGESVSCIAGWDGESWFDLQGGSRCLTPITQRSLRY